MPAHDQWGIPIRGQEIPVHTKAGAISMERVETVDSAGLPTIGGPRLDDERTFLDNRELARRKAERGMARNILLAIEEEDIASLIDMGGIGGRVSAA